MSYTVKIEITGNQLGDLESALQEVLRLVNEEVTWSFNSNETGSYTFRVTGEEGEEDEPSVSILRSATEKLKPQEKFTVMLGKLKDYLASNPSFRTGQHWESGFAHGAFGLPCGGEPSEIEGYAAGNLWAEEYDREV